MMGGAASAAHGTCGARARNVWCAGRRNRRDALLGRTDVTGKLQSRTLAGQIVDDLRQAILDGEHPAGAQLRQDALAASYGVSRIPVREALFQLEAEGLVSIAPHKGAVVAPLSAAEIRDVFELRALLEVRLLRASAPRLEAEDFAAIRSIEAAFEAAIAAGDKGRWGALNAELHKALYRRAGMPRTEALVAGLLQTSERYTRLQLSNAKAWARASREHAELIRLCRKGDIEAAAALLERHIGTVAQDLLKLATMAEV
jgi:DNA-binding GntR family transcriptional regulator